MGFISKTNEIAYKEDIIKELSKELKISEKVLEEIININILYIKKSIIEKDYVLINIPNLCKIRLNNRLAKFSLAHLKKAKSIKSKIKIESLERKIKVLDNFKLEDKQWFKLLNYNTPLFERLWRKMKREKYITFLYKKMYKMIKDVEERTNEIIKEIT